MRQNFILTHVTLLLFFCLFDKSYSEEWEQVYGLRGKWKFEIGDDMKRAQKDFNDNKWETIYAPSAWEDQGYPGYDGYAWYRKHFKSSPDWQYKTLSLQLGSIDDVDEVYLNGHLVGTTGQFPPYYRTAYDANRVYAFPSIYLSNDGDNVVSVRVYDQELSGGILRGNLGVYEDIQAIKVDLRLPTLWKFNTGDDPEWKSPQFNDKDWENIVVPAYWETQGFSDYDGFAWYRVRFRVPYYLKDEKLILLLGKIDDFDETYMNGERIGKTGNMSDRIKSIPGSSAYGELRAYVIPSDVIRVNEDNVIAVRVYDGFKDGGIYQGPIGIVERDMYLKWQRYQKRNSKTNIFDWLFK